DRDLLIGVEGSLLHRIRDVLELSPVEVREERNLLQKVGRVARHRAWILSRFDRPERFALALWRVQLLQADAGEPPPALPEFDPAVEVSRPRLELLDDLL